LQDVGRREQQIADGEDVHPHPVFWQATADKQEHAGKAQQVCAQHANERGGNHERDVERESGFPAPAPLSGGQRWTPSDLRGRRSL